MPKVKKGNKRTLSVKVPTQTIGTRLLKDSIDIEARTVKMVFTSELPVRSFRFKGFEFEEFNEVLSMEPGHMRRSRLDKGAVPLLDTHNRFDLSAQLGTVLDARSNGTLLEGEVKFSKREAVQEIFTDVVDGIINNGSIGYKVHKYEDVSGPDDKIPTLRAVDWELLEMSLVPVGADENAGTMNGKRSHDNEIEMNDCEIVLNRSYSNKDNNNHRSNNIMDPKELEKLKEQYRNEANEAKKAELADVIAKAEADTQVKVTEAVEAEKTRCVEIRKAVKESGLDEGLADEYIERNVTVEQAKVNVELFKKYSKDQEATNIQATQTVKVGGENEGQRREGITEMLLHRMDAKNFEITDRAREFAGQSLMRVLEGHLGRGKFENDIDFAQRAMSSSDLPLILANVAEKSAQKRYELAPKTYKTWTSEGTLRNYKQASQLRAGDVGELKIRNEKGEYEESAIGEEQELAQLEQYGVKHAFSDKMIVNDDLGMILSVANETGKAVARLENKLAYAALTGNPAMADGFSLFDGTEHGNLGTVGAIGDTTFTEAFADMMNQKSVDDRDVLNVQPKYLIVGPALRAAAKKFLMTVQPTKTADVNIYADSLDLVVDAEIADDQYFFAADQNSVETVKVFHLEGQSGPKVASRFNWDNDCIELKIGHSVDAAPMDWRGLYKNKAT